MSTIDATAPGARTAQTVAMATIGAAAPGARTVYGFGGLSASASTRMLLDYAPERRAGYAPERRAGCSICCSRRASASRTRP